MEKIIKDYLIRKDKKSVVTCRKEIGLSSKEDNRIKSGNWIKINDIYYYIKSVENYNEIVGELYANILKLNSAHYELIKYPWHNLLKKYLYYKSENFIKPNITYEKTPDIFSERYILKRDSYFGEYYVNRDKKRPCIFNGFDEFKLILSKKNYKILEDQLIKLFAIDIFMRQLDRCDVNIIFESKNEEIYLGPVFDYSASLDFDARIPYNNYINEIQDILMNEEFLDKFIEQHPKLYDYIKQLYDVDMVKLLSEELKKYDLKLSWNENYKYEQEIEISRCNVKRLILK